MTATQTPTTLETANPVAATLDTPDPAAAPLEGFETWSVAVQTDIRTLRDAFLAGIRPAAAPGTEAAWAAFLTHMKPTGGASPRDAWDAWSDFLDRATTAEAACIALLVSRALPAEHRALFERFVLELFDCR